jgi:mono/diheme cytochrome c family protein
MKKFALLTLIVATTLILAACGGGGAEAVATLEPVPAEFAGKTNPFGADAVTDGAAVFKTNCESCHGPLGHGDGPAGEVLDPKPKNLGELQQRASDDYLFWRVNTGKPGTSMAPWAGILTEDQIWQVIAFIRTLQP